MKVTALKLQTRNKARVNVYVDGKFAFALVKIAAARLAIGQELDEAAMERVQQVDESEQAYELALKFLAPRPRSTMEVRRRLAKDEVPAAAVEAVIQRLTRAGLVDDKAFADFWVENRGTFRPRSKRALHMELKQKGLPDEAVREALSESDDAGAAAALAGQRVRRLSGLEYQDFRRKLSEYLARRGFDYETIKPVVEQAWKNRAQNGSG